MGQCDSKRVSHGHSKTMLLDPVSGRVSPGDSSPRIPATESMSPNGKWIAFACSTEICLRLAAGGETIRGTGGNCNSYAPPAWELDSSGIVFASDCGRGLGLPALYRARVANIKMAATSASTAAVSRTNRITPTAQCGTSRHCRESSGKRSGKKMKSRSAASFGRCHTVHKDTKEARLGHVLNRHIDNVSQGRSGRSRGHGEKNKHDGRCELCGCNSVECRDFSEKPWGSQDRRNLGELAQ